jgi:DNA-binding MltR family transcriptional regulator
MRRKIPGIEKLNEESQALYRAINEEPDLPCVLIATSYLDQCLASLLERYFRKVDTAQEILDPIKKGILGAFSARADLCYCLGISTKELHQNLRTVARIRNRFAHSYLSISFKDAEVGELCKKLKLPEVLAATRVEGDTGKSYDVKDPFAKFSAPRDRFSICTILMASSLWLIGLNLREC